MKTKNTSIISWLIYIIATLAFICHYPAREAINVLVPDLILSFNCSAEKIASLVSYFSLGYVGMQIPVGIIIDKYGAKLPYFIAILLASVMIFVFSNTSSIEIATFSRIFYGACTAFCFITTLKLARSWFSAEIYSILAGVTQGLGFAGAGISMFLLPRFLEIFNWTSIFNYLAILMLLVSFLILLIVKSPDGETNHSNTSILSPLLQVISSKKTWLVSIVGGLLFTPITIYGNPWGPTFLRIKYEISAQSAGEIISLIYVGWAIGGPIAGGIANIIGRKTTVTISSIITCVLFSIIIYSNNLSYTQLVIAHLFFGIFNTGLIACYTMAAELNPKGSAGSAIAFSNGMSVALGTLIIGPIVAKWLDQLNQGSPVSGIIPGVTFSSAHFHLVFSLVVFSLLLSTILSLFLTETYERKKSS